MEAFEGRSHFALLRSPISSTALNDRARRRTMHALPRKRLEQKRRRLSGAKELSDFCGVSGRHREHGREVGTE